MKKVGFLAVVAGIALILVAASPGTFPIYRGFLQSDLNGNGFSITNVLTFQGTNAFITNAYTTNSITFNATNHAQTWLEGVLDFRNNANQLYPIAIHQNNDNTFGIGFFNDTYSLSHAWLEAYGENNGTAQMGTHDAKDLNIYAGGELNPIVILSGNSNALFVHTNLYATNITSKSVTSDTMTNTGLISISLLGTDSNGKIVQSSMAPLDAITNHYAASNPPLLLSNQLYLASLTNNMLLGRVLTADFDVSLWSAVPSPTNAYIHIGGREFGIGYPRAITFGYRLLSDSFSPAAMTFTETSDANRTKGRLAFWTRDVTTDTAPTSRMTIEPDGTVIAAGKFSANGITNTAFSTSGVVTNDSNGNLGTVAQLPAAEFPALTGDITTSAGSTATTLKNTGTAGTYYKTTFDAQGRETSGITTVAMADIVQPGFILTNGGTTAATYSNNFAVDNSHFLTGNIAALTITNAASAGSRIQITDANKKLIDAAASGAVPIDADGTATTAAQISALVTINQSGFTNNVTSQSANYNVASTDWLVLLTGAHTATLPTAVGIPGKSFIIKCSSAGTNAILTTSSQTIDGAAKWTNTASLKFTWVISDGANWRVIGQN